MQRGQLLSNRTGPVSDVEQFEILVLGSGEAGKYLAWTMAKAGHRTAMVERRWLGGSCPNIACLPSKNLIYAARVASLVRRGAEFGLETKSLAVSMKDVQRRKRLMVEGLHQMHVARTVASGVDLIMGEGRFVAPRTVEIALNDGGSRRIFGERVFLVLGSRATMPKVPGLAAANPMTSGAYGIGTISRSEAAIDPRSAPMLNTLAQTTSRTNPTAPSNPKSVPCRSDSPAVNWKRAGRTQKPNPPGLRRHSSPYILSNS